MDNNTNNLQKMVSKPSEAITYIYCCNFMESYRYVYNIKQIKIINKLSY